jgi:predicted MFS family arabinose efflux permease
VALNSLQFNLSRAIGPAIAGLLLARAGTGVCFGVNALSFVAVIVALWRLDMPAPPRQGRESLGESLRAGLRHVRASPVLSRLVVLGAACSFLSFPLLTYLPVIADEMLGSGAAGYSLLLSSFGAGAIVGAIATAQRGNRPGRGRLMLVAFVSYAATTLVALLSRSQTLSMGLLFLSGGSLVTAFSTLNSLVQEHSPTELRGRVVSIYGLAFRGGMPVGSLVAGALVAPFGPGLVIGSLCGLLGLGASLVLGRDTRVPRL